jgi:hypothetical protein
VSVDRRTKVIEEVLFELRDCHVILIGLFLIFIYVSIIHNIGGKI